VGSVWLWGVVAPMASSWLAPLSPASLPSYHFWAMREPQFFLLRAAGAQGRWRWLEVGIILTKQCKTEKGPFRRGFYDKTPKSHSHREPGVFPKPWHIAENGFTKDITGMVSQEEEFSLTKCSCSMNWTLYCDKKENMNLWMRLTIMMK